MVYSSQNASFRRDKLQFFSDIASVENLDTQIGYIDNRVQNMGYGFLLENQNTLETEFTEMFTILQKQDDENKEVFWVYCYYCASLLEAFYKAYSQEDKADKYHQIKKQIKERLQNDKKHTEAEADFIHSLYQSFLNGLRNLVTSPYHLSQIRDYVAYSNLCRIYWVFCRLTLTQGLTVAKDLKLIEKLDVLLGTHTDVDKIISVIQAPTFVINYFSVGFFLARFMIDGGLLLRHTFFPTELEKGAENSCEIHKMDNLPGSASIEAYRNSYIVVQNTEANDMTLFYIPKSGPAQRLQLKDDVAFKNILVPLFDKAQSIRLPSAQIKETITNQTQIGHIPEVTTRFDRFKHELYKRHCNFANDLVWGTVNFLTNFNHITNISGPVAGYITAVFLVFDVGMAFYKCNLAKEEYLTKKTQYEQEIRDYQDQEQFKNLSKKQKEIHIEMLKQQMISLEIDWQTKEAAYYFVAAAAALLMIGFTASMLVSPALLVVGCYFACTIAVAMYLSAGVFSQYQEKSLQLEHAQLTSKNLPVALKEYETARNEFIFTMTKNTIVPTVLITTFAICWPAAIALTAMYLGYEIYHAYSQHTEGKEIKALALNESIEDADENHLLPSPSSFS
jgi:hypothetical protein